MKKKSGDRIWFAEEKAPYRVRVCNDRWLICTKPFNPRRTVLYTIVDLTEDVRGPENLVFGMGAETDEQCREMLDRLNAGESEISHRRRVPLNIVRMEKAAKS